MYYGVFRQKKLQKELQKMWKFSHETWKFDPPGDDESSLWQPKHNFLLWKNFSISLDGGTIFSSPRSSFSRKLIALAFAQLFALDTKEWGWNRDLIRMLSQLCKLFTGILKHHFVLTKNNKKKKSLCVLPSWRLQGYSRHSMHRWRISNLTPGTIVILFG